MHSSIPIHRTPLATVAGLLLLAVALFCLAAPAGAATYCVDMPSCPNGVPLDHDELGTALQESAESGEADTIEIGASDVPYEGDFDYSSGSPLTIVGAGAGETVLTGEPLAGAILELPNAATTVEDLEIRVPSQATLRGLTLGGISRQVVIRQTGPGTEAPFGLTLLPGGSFEQGSVLMTSGRALYAESAGERLVSGSRLYSTQRTVVAHGPLDIAGTHIHGGELAVTLSGPDAEAELDSSLIIATGSGIEASNGATVTGRSLTIVKPGEGGGTGVISYNSVTQKPTSLTLENSIISGFGSSVHRSAVVGLAANATLDHSAWSSDLDDGTGEGSITVLGDARSGAVPEFVNPDPINPLQEPNYRLRTGSELIDAGKAGVSERDLDGNLRPLDGDGLDGAAPDIGAYEHAAVPPQPQPQPPAGEGPGQGAPSAEPRRAGVAKAVLGRGGLRATGGKTVQLRLSCSADGPCAGTVKLLAAGQKLGARRFALAAGGRGSFALQLRRPARSLLTGAPEVGVKVLVRSRQADGSAVVRSARTQLKGEVTPPPAPRGGSGGTP